MTEHKTNYGHGETLSLIMEGINCYGSMSQPQRTIRVTLDGKSVEVDADLLKQMLAEADAEALRQY
jgi:hypothetical protein